MKKKDYKFGAPLGNGTFGKVIRCTWKTVDPPREVAMKVIPKKAVKGKEGDVMSEMEVLKDLDHPNIVSHTAGLDPAEDRRRPRANDDRADRPGRAALQRLQVKFWEWFESE